MDKKDLVIGAEYKHRFRGKCIYSEVCAFMEKTNADPTSIVMDFGEELAEVTLNLIEKA